MNSLILGLKTILLLSKIFQVCSLKELDTQISIPCIYVSFYLQNSSCFIKKWIWQLSFFNLFFSNFCSTDIMCLENLEKSSVKATISGDAFLLVLSFLQFPFFFFALLNFFFKSLIELVLTIYKFFFRKFAHYLEIIKYISISCS